MRVRPSWLTTPEAWVLSSSRALPGAPWLCRLWEVDYKGISNGHTSILDFSDNYGSKVPRETKVKCDIKHESTTQRIMQMPSSIFGIK